jgi:2-C-methyl-D-erythritol 4-phosphate cytidylyltransferase
MTAFEKNDKINNIVVIAQNEYFDYIKEQASKFGISKFRGFANAGAERQESVSNALKLDVVAKSDIILIHDAARPFINNDIIDDSINYVMQFGAAIPATRPKETIKRVNSNLLVEKTLDRSVLRMIQTPQAFKKDILYEAYKSINPNEVATDDASLVERIGKGVYIFDGLEYNIKITTKIDLIIATKLIEDSNFLQ